MNLFRIKPSFHSSLFELATEFIMLAENRLKWYDMTGSLLFLSLSLYNTGIVLVVEGAVDPGASALALRGVKGGQWCSYRTSNRLLILT